MFRILGENLRKQFESELDLNQMKLEAIRNDFIELKIKAKTRGNEEFLHTIRQNIIILFGCKPGEGVWSNT